MDGRLAGGGAALLVKVLTHPSMPPDARLGASIVAAVFIPMGLALGVTGLVQLVRQRGGGNSGSRRTQGGAGTSGPESVRDPWSRLKALNDLRSTGALTRAEFDTLKADLARSEPDGPRDPAIDHVALIRQLADERDSGALSEEEFEASKRRVMLGERVY